MAIEVRIPDEIEDYKESIIMGLSLRQLVWGSIALICGTPTYILLNKINNDLAVYSAMAITLPSFLIGFVKKGGYPFEKYIKIMFHAMVVKSKRGYIIEENENDVPIEILEYKRLQDKLNKAQLEQNFMRGVKEDVQKSKANRKRTKTKRTKGEKRAEFSFIEVTTKSTERKRKTARKEVKAATRSYR